MDRFLILRCRARDTLMSFERMVDEGYNTLCPTRTVHIRIGKDRKKKKITIPLLPSFLFMEWDGDIRISSSLPYYVKPMVQIERYAHCTIDQILGMNGNANGLSDVLAKQISIGRFVTVERGLLEGVIGRVREVRPSGDVVLQIVSDLGWEINTCTVHGSVLSVAGGP